MLGPTAVSLAGLASGAQAAADPTVPILVTNHNPHDLIVIPVAPTRFSPACRWATSPIWP